MNLAHNTIDFMSEVSPEPAIIEASYMPDARRRQQVVRYYGYVAITDEERALDNFEEARRMQEIMAQ